MTDIKKLYNRRASLYSSLMDSMRSKSTATGLLSILPKRLPMGSHILDIGAGSGLATATLHNQYPNAQLTALDFSQDLLKILQIRLPKVKVIIADMNQTPQVSSSPFSLIVSTGAVSEYGWLKVVLPWIYQMLKPNGLFINIGVDDNILGQITGFLWHFQPQSHTAFVTACRSAGFVSVEKHSSPPNIFFKHCKEYIVTARRPT